MTAKQMTLNNATGAILAAALFTVASGALFGSEDSDLLNDAAVAYRSNLDSLVSLSGHVSMLRESEKDGVKFASQKEIQFAYDWKTGGEYFFSRTDSPLPQAREGEKPQRFAPLFEAQLFTNGLYYRVIHDVGYKGKKTVMAGAKPFSRPEFYNGAFVPPYFMSYEGAKFDEVLSMYADNFDAPAFDGRLIRDGDVVVLSRFLSNPERKMEIHVDLSKSGNPIRIERELNRNGRVSNTVISWEWKKTDGVWIPSEIRRTVTNSESDTKKSTSTILRWHDCQVNGSVDDAIQLASLGLYRGDRLEDVRTGEKSIFEDASLPLRRVSASESPVSESRGNTEIRRWPWLLIANIAVVIVVSVFTFLVRRRRRHSGE